MEYFEGKKKHMKVLLKLHLKKKKIYHVNYNRTFNY